MNKQTKRFCEEYIIDDVGSRAAIRSGYSEATAAQQACNLLRRLDVKEYIKELRDARTERLEISADKVLEQIRRLAFSDINDYYYYKFELGYYTGTTEKEQRKRDRLIKYIGHTISEDKYNDLDKAYKYWYRPFKTLKVFEDMTVEQRAAIQSITYDKHGNAILKLSDREKSLDQLGKHLGIFEKDNAQKATKVSVEQRTLHDFYGANSKITEEVESLKIIQH